MAGYLADKRRIWYNDKKVKLGAQSWIEPQGAVSVFEDFLGTFAHLTVATGPPRTTEAWNWAVAQSGTPTTNANFSTSAGAPTAGHGGWLAGSVDNVDAEIDEIAIGSGVSTEAPWMSVARAGTSTLVVEWGFVVPTALTARQYFAGFSDDPTEGTTTNGPVNIQTAYTTVTPATDAAGWLLSSLATNPTIWKYGSVNAGTDATVAAATEGVTAVVDCYTVCRVEIDSAGNAYFLQSIASASTVGRQEPTLIGATTLAVATTALLVPIFTAAATTTTAVEWELDYCFAACPR